MSMESLNRQQRATVAALKTLKDLESVKPDPLKGEELLALDKLRLNYYPAQGKTRTAPLLICYALVNRPYILDLEPGRSLIRDLVEGGTPVYLIDWGYPDLTDRNLSLEDYLQDYIEMCVLRVKQHSGVDRVNLLGVCQGGVFSLLYAAMNPDQINRLVTLVTPIDASVAEFTLAQMIRQVDVARLVAVEGNLPGAMLNQLYASLRPLQLGVYKQLRLAENLSTEQSARSFLRMEHWLNDTPNLAGRAATQFADQFFKGNALVEGAFNIAGRSVSLKTIEAPVLNIFGKQDYLVPPSSSRALAACLSDKTEYKELALAGGHIGAFISNRSRHRVVEAVQSWLAD